MVGLSDFGEYVREMTATKIFKKYGKRGLFEHLFFLIVNKGLILLSRPFCMVVVNEDTTLLSITFYISTW